MIPDVATRIIDKKNKDGMRRNYTYRVTSWLKAVPRRPISNPSNVAEEIIIELFEEWHPNWKYEYKLEWCVREEATHVCGAGISGCIADLSDTDQWEFTNEYVNWSKETIDERRESANNMVGLFSDLVIKGEKHD
jgi:hypothetical protein